MRALVVIPALFLIASVSGRSQTSGYWHTSGNQIVDSNNQPVRMSGVNWYGFELTTEVVQGLWAQDYKQILNTTRNNGYNVIRMPFSNQMVEHPIVPSNINYGNGNNSDLQGLNSLQILDKIVAYAGQLGLHIILDNHRSDAGSGTENGLWYTQTYPESAWIADWQNLANRYLNNSIVIGFDLRNEPHDASNGGACWDCGSMSNDWHLAAERGGNAALAINPHLLIFVEGTDCYNGDCDWWGGNLEGVQHSPVLLNVQNQLVYSAHDYGPNLYQQNWFNGSTSYASLVSVWTKFWAYISINGTAPVWLGEFGTTNNSSDIQGTTPGSQGQWFQSLVSFLEAQPRLSWIYWALDGEDSYGLLDNNYDSTPASALKQQMLASIQGSGGGGGTPPPAAPTNVSASPVSASQINIAWTASTSAGVTYNVYAAMSSGFTPSAGTRVATNLASTTFNQQGLVASTTYYYLVTAVNSGGESGPSNQASATTPGGSGGSSCQVTYSVVNQWNNGFTAGITIANNGSSTINNWTLSWTWPGNQQITQSWSGNYTQTGASAVIVNASWNGTIAPGSNVSGIGFNANFSGANPVPAVFSLNGSPCNGAGGPSAPAAPTNLTASPASSSQINLSWSPSPTSGVTYSVYSSTTPGFTPSAGNRLVSGLSAASYQNTGLAAATAYYYRVTAVNGSGESAASNQATATTNPNPPPPPTQPSMLSASPFSSSQINLSWTASTTAGVTYNVYSGTAPGLTPSAANRIASNLSATSFQRTGLAASTTYYFLTTAVNAGGESPASNQASAATMPISGGGGSCHITYVDQNDWKSGFTGNISITNNGSAAINNWTLTWMWSGNQQLSGAWNANGTQSGQNVTFTNASWNNAIAAGGTLTGIGFNANYSGSNAVPAAFYLNGSLCR